MSSPYAPHLHALAIAPLAIWGGWDIAGRSRGGRRLLGVSLCAFGVAAFLRGVSGIRSAAVGGFLPGGRGDALRPSDVDAGELARGVEVEREHFPDDDVAREIALDHLAEDPRYYEKLRTVHAD